MAAVLSDVLCRALIFRRAELLLWGRGTGSEPTQMPTILRFRKCLEKFLYEGFKDSMTSSSNQGLQALAFYFFKFMDMDNQFLNKPYQPNMIASSE